MKQYPYETKVEVASATTSSKDNYDCIPSCASLLRAKPPHRAFLDPCSTIPERSSTNFGRMPPHPLHRWRTPLLSRTRACTLLRSQTPHRFATPGLWRAHRHDPATAAAAGLQLLDLRYTELLAQPQHLGVTTGQMPESKLAADPTTTRQ